MKLNPIFSRELSVQTRGYQLPLLFAVLNGILFFAGLLGIFGVSARVQLSSEQDYGAYLGIFMLIAFLSFTLLILITPSLTAGAISGERQSGTLDLLLTTQLSPAGIVFGKLSAAAALLAVLICSALPALLIPPVYGGVGMLMTVGLLLIYLVEAVFLLTIGLFASTVSSTVLKSSALAYGLTAALCVGTVLLAVLVRPFGGSGRNYAAALLILNPLVTAGAAILEMVGQGRLLAAAFAELNLLPDSGFLRFFVPISLLLQLTLTFVLFLLCVMNITPARDGRRILVKQRIVK